MCDIPHTKDGQEKRFNKAKKQKEKREPLYCGEPEEQFPKFVTMVKWSRPILLTNLQGLGRVPVPNGGYVEYHVDSGFPMRPKIPGLLGPLVTVEDIDMSIEETAEILGVMFPEKQWMEGDRKWLQKVSPLPAKRGDVIKLAEELQVRLLRSQAPLNGICPIRQELYSQCFDEIIRQVTVNFAERGLLLFQVRDELMLTLKIYQELVEQAKDFGLRKYEQVKDEEAKLKAQYEELCRRKKELERENQEGRIKMANMSRMFKERRKSLERTRNLRLAYLRRSNDQFFYMLDNIGLDKKFFFHLI